MKSKILKIKTLIGNHKSSMRRRMHESLITDLRGADKILRNGLAHILKFDSARTYRKNFLSATLSKAALVLDFDIIYDIIILLSAYKISTFKSRLEANPEDPELKKAWEESQVEYQLACELIAARAKRKMSQRDLASKVGTSQAAISRIEAMNSNPSLLLLKRIANALDVKLAISF